MKFKRILAAVLSSLMLVSMMSFTATVSAADDGIIKQSVLDSGWNLERGDGAASKNMYDAETGIGYRRLIPRSDLDTVVNATNGTTIAKSSSYINLSGQGITFTEAQAKSGELYIVLYARTNMTMDSNDIPYVNMYTLTWSDGTTNSGTTTIVDGYATQLSSEWQKFCFKLNTTKSDGAVYATKWTQVAAFLADDASGKPIGEWWSSVAEGETPYVDFGGYAVVDSLEAAVNYDFTTKAAAPKVTLTFDANNVDGDTDVTTTEVASGKWNTAATVAFPEVTAPAGMELAGWSTTTDVSGIIDTEAGVAIPNTNTTYTAIWQEEGAGAVLELSEIKINGTTAATYGVTDLSAEEIVIKLPYGWEKLETLGVMPTVVPTAALGEAVYTAPATLAEAGKITITNDGASKDVPVKFEIAESADAKSSAIPSGVYSTNGTITLKDGTVINTDSKTRAVGTSNEKTELNGVSARKYTPIYTGSEKDGTKVSNTEYYSSNRGVNLEGHNAFGLYNYETYSAYRILAYYDKGANNAFDVTPYPSIYFQGGSTTGTVKTSGTGDSNGIMSVNSYNGGRWEYIYFVKDENTTAKLYGKAIQPVFSFFSRQKASAYTDDVFYVAEITALPDVPDYVQYQPTGLVPTAVNGNTLGSVAGLTDDMEMLVGEAWVAVTELENYANGTVTGLAAGTYSFRYAATDVLLASDAAEVKVLPGAVTIKFDPQNGEEASSETVEINTAVTAPAENPVRTGYIFKGWAETADGTTQVDFTNVTATVDKTYYAIWELITKVYVDGTVETAGDGLTADAPVKELKTAWDTLRDNGGTIVIVGDTVLDSRSNPDVRLENGMGDIVITNKDGDTTYDGKLIFAYQSSFKNSADATGKLTFENIKIVQEHSYNGSSKNTWRYVNFDGIEVEFGEGVTVPSTKDADGYTTLKMRIGGEADTNHFGRKTILRSGSWGVIVLGGKNNSSKPFSVDFEYYGGSGDISLGNDSRTSKKTVDGVEKSYYTYGAINDMKLLFEEEPTKLGLGNVSAINGTVQVIVNNGKEVAMPSFTWTNTNDTTTNADGSAYTVDLTPKGGYWKINSAVGGRFDFTETAGTFKVTTDETYIVVTNKATGEATKIRVADGVSGEANLFADNTVSLAAGEYDITYTDEAVKIDVTFANGDDSETYTIAKGETATYTGEVSAIAGKVFVGWSNADGTIKLEGNSYTADTYIEGGITFYPEYEDDTTVPYYYAYGEYDAQNQTYTVDVKIANGKFTAGTLGVAFDKDILAYKSYTLGEGVSNNIGDAPEIVKDYMYDGEDDKFILVWDAAAGVIDASEEQVTIVTFEFDVVDTEYVENALDSGASFFVGAGYYAVRTNYDKYYVDGYYLVSPENTSDNPYAVDYVPVYFGLTVNKEKSYEKATVTFNVTFASKLGETKVNPGELILWTDDNIADEIVYTIDPAGNSQATVTKVVEDYYVGDTFSYCVHKNGYMYVEEYDVVAEDGMTINITLLAGDIKDSTEYCCGDGEITLADFVRVVRAFEDSAAVGDYRKLVDLDEDGIVTVNDLGIIKTNFGKTSADNTVVVVKAEAE